MIKRGKITLLWGVKTPNYGHGAFDVWFLFTTRREACMFGEGKKVHRLNPEDFHNSYVNGYGWLSRG